MKLDVKFKSVDYSPGLVEYAQERLSKLEKYEVKPTVVHLTFSEEGHEANASVYVKGCHGNFRATATGETFQSALDDCMRKLKRQMEKEKSIIKHHHNYDLSHEAQLEYLAWQEEQSRKRAA